MSRAIPPSLGRSHEFTRSSMTEGAEYPSRRPKAENTAFLARLRDSGKAISVCVRSLGALDQLGESSSTRTARSLELLSASAMHSRRRESGGSFHYDHRRPPGFRGLSAFQE